MVRIISIFCWNRKPYSDYRYEVVYHLDGVYKKYTIELSYTLTHDELLQRIKLPKQ